MGIEFKTPETIEQQLRPVQVVAENVMRPESRQLDDHEHARPVKFVQMMWPQMREMERTNLEAALRRAQQESTTGNNDRVNGQRKEQEKRASQANMIMIHMI